MILEGLLVNGVTEIIKKLLPIVSEHIALAGNSEGGLIKLHDTLESIQVLLSDAQDKQVNDADVSLWLKRLKEVVYDADDVMDEYSYNTMRHNFDTQLKNKVQNFVVSPSFVFNYKMAQKIRVINEKLDSIYRDKDRYTLRSTSDTSSGSHMYQTIEQRNRLTASVVDDSALMGREDAKLEIIKRLKLFSSISSLSLGKSSQQEKLHAVCIIGMGGLGKTSLAQLVYEDESVGKHFELKLWVCVSEKLDVYKILKQIIESITKVKCEDTSNVDVLATQVREVLIDKKYLLVLDDLWNEDTGDWEKLKGFLVFGAQGSKILVTTRNQNVASVVRGSTYNLQNLTDDVCWSIMEKKIASPGGPTLTSDMINIGRKIAKKCGGLPLAANSLGSLMYTRREESYWLSIIKDDNLWNTPENGRVIKILRLSYDNLPSHLKQCFSYCCIFPKNWEIKREALIRIWMAEGFLQPSGEVTNKSVEDIGNDYFKILLWNSFFQDIKKDELGVIDKCKMHDIVHDLAMSIDAHNEFRILKGSDGEEDVSQIRRLQVVCARGSSSTLSAKLCKARNLRTVAALYPDNCSDVKSFFSIKRLRVLYPLGHWDTSLSSLVLKLKHLRYLDLSQCEVLRDVSLNRTFHLQTLVLCGCVNVSGLLGDIGSLRNLRHFDISSSDISVLPVSIVNLSNLQTLNLSGCRYLKALPENIGLLIHLSWLDISDTPITKIPDSITCISNLVTLRFFGCLNLAALPEELGELTRLKCLDLNLTKITVLPESCNSSLCNLEIIRLGGQCELPAEIKNWPKLRQFRCTRDRYDEPMPRGIEKLTCLEILESYAVRKEAEICGSSIHLSGVDELAALNSLQVLRIKNLENVIGGKVDAERAKLNSKQKLLDLSLHWGFSENVDELVLEGLQPHSSLKKLEINGFPGSKFPEWVVGSSFNILLPNLVKLEFRNCKTCEKLPAVGMLPSLRYLTIMNMDSIKCLGEEFYYQQQEENSSRKREEGSNTRSFTTFPSLIRLEIIDMENLVNWFAPPTPSHSFLSLEHLKITNCKRLRSTPNSFPALQVWKTSETNGNMIRLVLAAIKGGYLTSLTSISIENSREFMYFPLGVLLQHNTPNLHSLQIRNCSEFQGFHDDDLNDNSKNSNSLCSLELNNCLQLSSLPDLRLWTSLRKLTIFRCNKLKESIHYNLKETLTFLELLKVDFIQRDEQQGTPPAEYDLINLMEKK